MEIPNSRSEHRFSRNIQPSGFHFMVSSHFSLRNEAEQFDQNVLSLSEKVSIPDYSL